ncbi:MAG TPA: hypothetical protein VH540_07230 [Ktedonobacterales bacterium]|jgi:hypothetical protein
MVAIRKQEGPEDAFPFSCSTNYSKAVNEGIKRLKPGPLATAFLMEMHNATFGDAGWHRKHKRSELSCSFDLAIWGNFPIAFRTLVRTDNVRPAPQHP